MLLKVWAAIMTSTFLIWGAICLVGCWFILVAAFPKLEDRIMKLIGKGKHLE